MKQYLKLIVLVFFISSCGSYQSPTSTERDLDDVPEEDIVRFSDDQLEYDIIIIDPGFNGWLARMAQPEGYYSQSFMEARNRIFVQEWNLRALEPTRFDPLLYEVRIDYDPNINYGYELNYKLYNYFIYFQLTYNQRLSSFVPRI
ncbi:MAG: hypothetical protein HRU26_15080 [Psychroserpens sp.]|nr:hypothetical protein [Psychroserpens sp.]